MPAVSGPQCSCLPDCWCSGDARCEWPQCSCLPDGGDARCEWPQCSCLPDGDWAAARRLLPDDGRGGDGHAAVLRRSVPAAEAAGDGRPAVDMACRLSARMAALPDRAATAGPAADAAPAARAVLGPTSVAGPAWGGFVRLTAPAAPASFNLPPLFLRPLLQALLLPPPIFVPRARQRRLDAGW
eukprot:gene9575-7052_t